MFSSNALVGYPDLIIGFGNDDQANKTGSRNTDFEVYAAESLDLAFDFDPTLQTDTQSVSRSWPPSPREAQPPASRAGSRISLACIPCRERHVRCNAAVPVCERFNLENKLCSYAKSRRGGQNFAVRFRRRAAMQNNERPHLRTPGIGASAKLLPTASSIGLGAASAGPESQG